MAIEAIVARVDPVRVRVERLGGDLSSECALGVPVAVGDRVLTVMSNEGRPWIIARLLDDDGGPE